MQTVVYFEAEIGFMNLRTINPMNKREDLDRMSCSTGNDCNDCLILNDYFSLTDATISSRR